MHTFVELLPIFCGFAIALLFVLIKSFPFKLTILVALLFTSGTIISLFNGESNAQTAVDILLSLVGALPCLIIGRYRTWFK